MIFLVALCCLICACGGLENGNHKSDLQKYSVQIRRNLRQFDKEKSRENKISNCDSSESDSQSISDYEPAKNPHFFVTESTKLLSPKTTQPKWLLIEKLQSAIATIPSTITPWFATIEDSNRNHQATITVEEVDSLEENINTDFTYTVSVQRKGAHYASGALVGARWVITSAAEFFNTRETLRLFRVRIGSLDCKRGGTIIPIKTVEIHPSFIPGNPGYDLGMLQLVHPVVYNELSKPIPLSTDELPALNVKFQATYWPKIVRDHKVLSREAKERRKWSSMRVSTQLPVPRRDCRETLADVNVTLLDSTLCLQPVEILHSVCMPDPGAPVMADEALWGVTSSWVSPTCPTAPAPTLVTRVGGRDVRDWLQGLLGPRDPPGTYRAGVLVVA